MDTGPKALIYAATISPTKAELIEAWLPAQPWAPSDLAGLELIGACRLDDPDGDVGLETHLVRVGDAVLQVPLTYRGAPFEDAADALVDTMEHSVLGPRWVYDGCGDPAFTRMLAAVILTGVGESAEIMERDGRQVTRAPSVVVRGGGWTGDLVAVDGWSPPEDNGIWTVLRSPDLELRVARRPEVGSVTDGLGLTGTWAGQEQPALLAAMRLRGS